MLSAVSRNVSVLRTGARSMSTIPVNQIASVLKLNAGGEDKVRAICSVCPVLCNAFLVLCAEYVLLNVIFALHAMRLVAAGDTTTSDLT